ncbi:conserved exported hypothetical protein [Candidatus Roizmanbacteria bacterium]|nr:conserved exported hypothetical protein [Candidatus Roizmanbacteria bacterium]
MKPKITLLLILSSSLLFFRPSLVKSESETIPTIGEIQNIRQNVRKNILEQKEKRDTAKETMQAEREVRKAEMEKKKEEIKVKRETFRETLQTEREARKTKMEEMKESFKEKRKAFREKIETIKDERKKLLTEKIDNRMSTVNRNQTDRMINALNRLTEHINKLQERITQAKENNIDVSTVESAISTAQTAISSVLALVEQQAAKDYAFTISDEANLGQSVKASYDTLSQDLKNTQESLVKAKEAVVVAYKVAGTLEKITPTPTVVTP